MISDLVCISRLSCDNIYLAPERLDEPGRATASLATWGLGAAGKTVNLINGTCQLSHALVRLTLGSLEHSWSAVAQRAGIPPIIRRKPRRSGI